MDTSKPQDDTERARRLAEGLISIVITVRNEGRNIATLLDSLVVQEGPIEIIIIDSHSEDDTVGIVKRYQKRYPFIKLIVRGGKRGYCRNIGVNRAEGGVVAFTDGDCIVNPFWVKEIRNSIREGHNVVAGNTIYIGYYPFASLGRVELYYKGSDITYPSCNLAYTKEAFNEVGGFDPHFVTAEDIDLNYRAVEKGYTIHYNPDMIIYARARGTFVGFFKQAFWNGYGRKQLTLKHGRLWGNYSYSEMFRKRLTFWYGVRMVVAMVGYLTCKFLRHLREGDWQ